MTNDYIKLIKYTRHRQLINLIIITYLLNHKY